jgi:hypothetical protein
VIRAPVAPCRLDIVPIVSPRLWDQKAGHPEMAVLRDAVIAAEEVQ